MKHIRIYMLMLATAPLVACSGGNVGSGSSSSSSSTDSLSSGETNQAPNISCNLYRNSEVAPFRTVSTITGGNTFLETPIQGDVIRFDCRSTQDEDASNLLQYNIDENYKAATPNFAAQTSAQFTYSATQVGSIPMALKVVDTEGLSRVLTFALVVQCPSGIVPVLDTSKVSVTAGSNGELNYFNYNVAADAVTGGTGFQFSWDFNGDGVYAPYSMLSSATWTNSYSLANIYSINVTSGSQTRNVHLKVRNSCQFESDYTVALKFPNDNIPRTPASLAVQKPYFYVQSDISSSDATNARRNVDLLVTQYPADKYQRVICDYKKMRYADKGAFTIRAYNWYYSSDAGYNHGQQLKMTDIVDNLSVGTQTISSLNLSEADYLVSKADDGISSEDFEKNSTCQVTMRIIRSQGVQPCADITNADFTETAAITIVGEYSCPNLKDAGSGATVAVNNGKYYCQVANVNQCVGGGGGGGGNPPPQQ